MARGVASAALCALAAASTAPCSRWPAAKLVDFGAAPAERGPAVSLDELARRTGRAADATVIGLYYAD